MNRRDYSDLLDNLSADLTDFYEYGAQKAKFWEKELEQMITSATEGLGQLDVSFNITFRPSTIHSNQGFCCNDFEKDVEVKIESPYAPVSIELKKKNGRGFYLRLCLYFHFDKYGDKIINVRISDVYLSGASLTSDHLLKKYNKEFLFDVVSHIHDKKKDLSNVSKFFIEFVKSNSKQDENLEQEREQYEKLKRKFEPEHA